jgi:16S rRNA (cytidine1402-2'-O)-methyltransferase
MGACGMLSIVGTPIGNLSDASPRVIETLKMADVVLCEDTRVTSKLLVSFGIHVPLERADEHVLASKVPSILKRVSSGQHVAFVSDAGMPGLSDPGQRLVDAARSSGLPVEVIPGPSAAICALVASGIPMSRFFFEGFLPRKAAAQRKRLLELSGIPGALVIYESPKRVASTLQNVAEAFPDRQAALVRELTKVHEEVLRDKAPRLAKMASERAAAPGGIRGECVIVIGPPKSNEAPVDEGNLAREIQAGLADHESKSTLARRLAKKFCLSKSEVYNLVLKQAQEDKAAL